MSLNTWTRSGSEKAQSSQTIRILIKTLQYLAEDSSQDETREISFVNVAKAIIRSTFNPSSNHSSNEQVSVFFNAMGWKNTKITLTSADEAEILLGSNRHLDQDPDNIDGLRILLKSLATALGNFLFDRDVSASVDIDIHSGPTYRVKLRAIKKVESSEPVTTPRLSTSISNEKSRIKPVIPSSRLTNTSPGTKQVSSPIDTSQIFLPVLSNKLAPSRLHLILQDVLTEFSKSWYGEDPLVSDSGDEKENVLTLMTFLAGKALETDASTVSIGSQIGSYFGQALRNSYPEEQLLSQEILDGSAVGSIIRDIKARAFCQLKPGEKCGSEIGGNDRELCDFAMGLWEGFLSQLHSKEFTFTGFYPAGRRDPYCLMEFSVSQD